MGRILHGFSWAPHPRGFDGSQALGVLAPAVGFKQCVQV
jgi:hypothetical protein